nr:MAG TPA: hypothetical protein [Caudoviricetes sp.]
MSNPLFSALSNNPYTQLISQAKQLKSQISDPKAEVQKMLNSGQISQEQLNGAMSFAQQLINANKSSFFKG